MKLSLIKFLGKSLTFLVARAELAVANGAEVDEQSCNSVLPELQLVVDNH